MPGTLVEVNSVGRIHFLRVVAGELVVHLVDRFLTLTLHAAPAAASPRSRPALAS